MGGAWLVYLGVLLGTKCSFFSPPFLYLGDKHVFMINMFIKNGMYLSYIFAQPRASFGYIQYGFITRAVWRFSNNVPALLGVDS